MLKGRTGTFLPRSVYVVHLEFWDMNSLPAKKQEFYLLLVKYEGILQTIDALKEFVLTTCEKHTTLYLMEGNFNKLKGREQRGLISNQDLNLEENKIRENLFNFIRDLKPEETILSPFILYDPRDKKIYKVVELAGKKWMAENLNYYVGDDCSFYDNDIKNGEKYGRLYHWEDAKKACPPGWRLPTDEEWKSLAKSFGGYYDSDMHKTIGKPTKTYTALIEGGRSGWSAQLGGACSSPKDFSELGNMGGFWTDTELISELAMCFMFYREYKWVYRSVYGKNWRFSCRCVQDY